MKAIFLIISLLLIGGCSLAPPSHKPAYTAGELEIIEGCRAWVQAKEANKAAQMSSVPVDQIAFVMMHESTMQMINGTFGKQTDICLPGDEYAKAYSAYVEAQAEIATTTIKEIGSTARAGAYVYGAVKVSENFGDKDASSTSTTTNTTTTSTESIGAAE